MSNLQAKIPKKVDLRPKKHHGFHLLLVLFGIVMPPIAVALRFGPGGDLWLNMQVGASTEVDRADEKTDSLRFVVVSDGLHISAESGYYSC